MSSLDIDILREKQFNFDTDDHNLIKIRRIQPLSRGVDTGVFLFRLKGNSTLANMQIKYALL